MNNALPCDDGSACTEGDACSDGVCAGASAVDCDDGEPCTTDVCDGVSAVQPPVQHRPVRRRRRLHRRATPAPAAAASAAPTDCDDGNECTDDSCDPATGCVNTSTTPRSATTATPAPRGDACSRRQLRRAPALSCDDGDPCTDDSCAAGIGCVHVNNIAPCDDGNLCTVADSFAPSATASAVRRPTATMATDAPTDSCDPAVGCDHSHNTAPCDDASACTNGDVCAAGVCSGAAITCDDGDGCTDDSCDPAVGCTFSHNTAPCDDGQRVHERRRLRGRGVQRRRRWTCDDGDGCTDDSCHPAVGCTFSHNTAPCDDANACTANDSCVAGGCDGASVTCDDGDVCTDDTCDPAIGCLHQHNNAPCDDGAACTVADSCDGGGVCLGQPLDCDDLDPCTDDSCNVATGACIHTIVLPDQDWCEDSDGDGFGDPATLQTSCVSPGGTFVADCSDCNDGAGSVGDCDDGVGCSVDSCVAGGCVNDLFAGCLDAITLDPNPVTVLVGVTDPVTATCSFLEGLPPLACESDAVWSSSDPTIASTSFGTVRGIAPGSATVTVAIGATFASLPVTVMAVEICDDPGAVDENGDGVANCDDATCAAHDHCVLSSVEITPMDPWVDWGSTTALAAICQYLDDTYRECSEEMLWSSADPAIATVSNAPGAAGAMTATGFGNVTISATHAPTGNGASSDVEVSFTLETVIGDPIVLDTLAAQDVTLTCSAGFQPLSISWESSDANVMATKTLITSQAELAFKNRGAGTVSVTPRLICTSPLPGYGIAAMPATNAPPGVTTAFTVPCPPDQLPIGGGYEVTEAFVGVPANLLALGGIGWRIDVQNGLNIDVDVRAVAVCIDDVLPGLTTSSAVSFSAGAPGVTFENTCEANKRLLTGGYLSANMTGTQTGDIFATRGGGIAANSWDVGLQIEGVTTADISAWAVCAD